MSREHRKAIEAAWRERNRETIRAKHKVWRDANPDKLKKTPKHIARAADLWRKFGLTLMDFSMLLDFQYEACAVCRTSTPPTGWHVDHDHATGQVRGILCTRCNVMIGMALDKPDVLRAAADYLEGK